MPFSFCFSPPRKRSFATARCKDRPFPSAGGLGVEPSKPCCQGKPCFAMGFVKSARVRAAVGPHSPGTHVTLGQGQKQTMK